MPGLLFVYGTLRDPDLLSGVLGRSRKTTVGVVAAAAPGFAPVHYPGRIYPALVRRPGAAAPGLVLTDLTAFEIDLLDAFEGEEYRRGIIPVMVGEELHEAFAYLPAIAVQADAPAWTLAAWQEEHKARVLEGERATAEELRTKLIAIRPN
jgi:gamma-glutamylcyclotransferase (GGCT)/AIG2-like uncharacterized protein YtfP